LQQLVRDGTVIVTGDVLVATGSWSAALERAAALIDETHREHPERVGVSLTDLRNAITKEFPLGEVFDALMRACVTAASFVPGHRFNGPRIARNSRSRFGPRARTLRRALSAQPLEPPSRKELAPDAPSQRALKFLIESGEVIEIGSELVLSAAAVAQATAQVKAFVAKHGPGHGERSAAVTRKQPSSGRPAS
jgi:hypothetical protein